MSPSDIADVGHALDRLFLRLRERDADALQSRHARQWIVERLPQLDGRRLEVLAERLGHIQNRLRRAREDVLTDVREGEEHILTFGNRLVLERRDLTEGRCEGID